MLRIAPPDTPAPAAPRFSPRSPRRLGEPFPVSRRGRVKLPFRRDMGRGTTVALIGAAAAIGAAIRLAVNRGLSLDEIRNVDQAHQPFGQLIVGLIHTGVHPPLYPVLQWCVIRLLGDTNFAVRLPSIVAGVALIPAAAWLAVELFDRRTAVVVALLTAVAPVLVWYS